MKNLNHLHKKLRDNRKTERENLKTEYECKLESELDRTR